MIFGRLNTLLAIFCAYCVLANKNTRIATGTCCKIATDRENRRGTEIALAARPCRHQHSAAFLRNLLPTALNDFLRCTRPSFPHPPRPNSTRKQSSHHLTYKTQCNVTTPRNDKQNRLQPCVSESSCCLSIFV